MTSEGLEEMFKGDVTNTVRSHTHLSDKARSLLEETSHEWPSITMLVLLKT